MSSQLRGGIVVLGILSVLDLATPAVTDGDHPPMAVAIATAVLGSASLVLAVALWRGRAGAIVPLAVLRVVSALTAVPAFVVPGVPVIAKVAAAAVVLLTALGIGLLYAGSTTLRAEPSTR